MAVNIDTVYQTVLAIANKEQRGYITPLEFNLLASKAQREIFEQYFYDIKKYDMMHGNSTEFSDMLHILEEKIAPFRVDDQSLASVVKFEDTFEIDITDWTASANGTSTHVAPASTNSYNGGLKVLQNANGAAHSAESSTNIALTAGKKYVVNWEIIDMDEPSSYAIIIEDSGLSAHQYLAYEPALGNLSFTFIADATGAHNIRIQNSDTTDAGKYITIGDISLKQVDDATLANNVYRLGDISWTKSGAAYPVIAPEVTSNQIKKYNASPLARPTNSNPVYTRVGATSIKLYPTPTSTDTVTYSYVKTPTDPYWAYVVVPKSQGGNEYPLYDGSSAVDFELHESEETTLVNKILEMAGVIMKQQDVVQYASTKDTTEFQKENI